jgi:hypothetical protein
MIVVVGVVEVEVEVEVEEVEGEDELVDDGSRSAKLQVGAGTCRNASDREGRAMKKRVKSCVMLLSA